MLILGIFRPKYEKNLLSHFEISTLGFCQMQKFVHNKKKSNLETKMPCLGILRCKLKKLLSCLKSAPSNLLKWIVKILKFGTKIPFLGIFKLELKKQLAYLKSTPSNMSECKNSCKTKKTNKKKKSNLGPKTP